MNLRFLVFIPLALIQLSVPGWMIFRQEQVLKHGRVFKFKTAPVDPYDAFRGKYVALSFAIERGSKGLAVSGSRERKVWVQFEPDANGFAKIKQVSATRLHGDDAVAVDYYGDSDFSFPFDRYYMEEGAAPKADDAYRDNSRRNHDNAYATVRILDGRAVLEELYVDDKPIREFLREGGNDEARMTNDERMTKLE